VQRIAAISPGHGITFDIHFIKPFDGRDVASMQTVSLGDQYTLPFIFPGWLSGFAKKTPALAHVGTNGDVFLV
jgi:hypothetical protein